MTYLKLKKMLREASDKDQADILKRFFKTGKDEYGEGDLFLGIKVPVIRKIIKENSDLTRNEIGTLIKSEFHEERLAALLLSVNNFLKAGPKEKKEIYQFYIKNRERINNWDLIDLSAPSIIGAYMFDKDKSVLFELAASESLWDKRIAVLSTFYFIKQKKYGTTLQLAEILLTDTADLIQKAVGWMLREIGKRDLKTEERFLNKYYKRMPRTMLRYAIEKFPQEKRQDYLKGRI